MTRYIIDFKHEDIHQPRPWPVGIEDGVVTSGLGADDGAILIGFAIKGEQAAVFLASQIEEIDFTADELVPVFSNHGGFFNWDLAVRDIRKIEVATDNPAERRNDEFTRLENYAEPRAIATDEEIHEVLVDKPGKYGWIDFARTEEDAEQDRDYWYIEIFSTDDEGHYDEEIAVIVHRTADGRFPLDGEVANDKRANAQLIVNALNASQVSA